MPVTNWNWTKGGLTETIERKKSLFKYWCLLRIIKESWEKKQQLFLTQGNVDKSKKSTTVLLPYVRPQRPLGGAVKNDVCVSICAARVGPLRSARRSPLAHHGATICKGTHAVYEKQDPQWRSLQAEEDKTVSTTLDGPEPQQKISWQMLAHRTRNLFLLCMTMIHAE